MTGTSVAALQQLFQFPGLEIEITDDTGRSEKSDHLMLVIANGRYFAGSFDVAPRADLHDGKLDVVSIRNMGAFARMRAFGRVAKGTHETMPEVAMSRSRHLRIACDRPIRFQVDGEVIAAPGNVVEVESRSAALSVIVPEQWSGASNARAS